MRIAASGAKSQRSSLACAEMRRRRTAEVRSGEAFARKALRGVAFGLVQCGDLVLLEGGWSGSSGMDSRVIVVRP